MEFLLELFNVDPKAAAELAAVVVLLVSALKRYAPATIAGKNASAVLGLVLSFVLGAAQQLAPFTGLVPMDALAAIASGATVWVIATGSYDLVNGLVSKVSSTLSVVEDLGGFLDEDFPAEVPSG